MCGQRWRCGEPQIVFEARSLSRAIPQRVQITVNMYTLVKTCADYVFRQVVPFSLPKNGYDFLTEKRQRFFGHML